MPSLHLLDWQQVGVAVAVVAAFVTAWSGFEPRPRGAVGCQQQGVREVVVVQAAEPDLGDLESASKPGDLG